MPGVTDGRRLRSLRTRETIIDALMRLISDGNPCPTAAEVAARARVSVRSLYQHFGSEEGLFLAAVKRTYERIEESWANVDPNSPLEPRVAAFVQARARALEELLLFDRARWLMEGHSQAVKGRRIQHEVWQMRNVLATFAPELNQMERRRRARVQAGIAALTSADLWDHLRRGGLSSRSARDVVRDGLLCWLR